MDINNANVYATLSAGRVEYSRSDAAMLIDDLIAALEQAKEDGATHIVGLTGNYRGARYMHIGTVDMDDDDL